MTISPADLLEPDEMLLEAAGKGDVHTLERALDSGADLDARGEGRRGAMHLAAMQGRAPMVKYLLDKGLSCETTDAGGQTPLMAAAASGAEETLAVLLQAGANTDAQDMAGQTALMKAAAENKPGVAEALVKSFADIYMKDNSGRTAFGLAKEAKAGAVCVLLYPHMEANDREKTYAMAQKLRASGKISVSRPLKLRKPGEPS